MTELITRILNFFGQFKLLVMILPWEKAARVRLGHRVVEWGPGWHIKLPFIDEIIPINTRLRVADAHGQTLTTSDGACLTVSVIVGFKITDPLEALMKLHSPESSISALASSATAGIVSSMTKAELTIEKVEQHIFDTLADLPYEIEFVKVRNFAFVRTYRLLNDQGYTQSVFIEDRKL